MADPVNANLDDLFFASQNLKAQMFNSEGYLVGWDQDILNQLAVEFIGRQVKFLRSNAIGPKRIVMPSPADLVADFLARL